MRNAIVVKMLLPTTLKGLRWKATAGYDAKAVTLGHDYAVGHDMNALVAAQAFCVENGLDASQLVGGELPNGDYVFVFTNGDFVFVFKG